MTLTPLQIRYLLALMGEGSMDLIKPGGQFTGQDALALRERLRIEIMDEWAVKTGALAPSWVWDALKEGRLAPLLRETNRWGTAGAVVVASGRVVFPGDVLTRSELEKA